VNRIEMMMKMMMDPLDEHVVVVVGWDEQERNDGMVMKNSMNDRIVSCHHNP